MRVIREEFPVKRWVEVDHHRSHAMLGLYDSPFSAPLVFSFDGGGNDGYFKMYHGRKYAREPLMRLHQRDWNFGTA